MQLDLSEFDIMVEIFLFASIALVAFAYFGYPASLFLLTLIRRLEVRRSDFLPAVTYIVTVHNEERRINAKLLNTLELDYPRDRLEIVVASDGSTDKTNEIVKSHISDGVKLLEVSGRGGKENAQRCAVMSASGSILVFSDVATVMEANGLRRLTSNFADPTIGCVSSEDRVLGRDGKPSGEGLYIKYEMWLRSLESKVNSLVGLSGSLFAARKEVCQDFSSEMQSDFRTVLSSIKLGLRGISDPLAFGIYQDTADPKREWDRKVRTVVRGLTVFFRHLDLINPVRYGLFAYQLACHKLLRWLVPIFLLIAFFSNILLVQSGRVYLCLMVAQVLFYVIAVLGLRNPKLQRAVLVKVAAFFVAVNASIGLAWIRYLRGDRIVTWSPTRR